MNNKKITAADLDPELLVQLLNKNGNLTSAEKALANSCVGRDERIGEHQLPPSYTKAINDKLTELQNKVNNSRSTANKIDVVDLSANITNKLNNMEAAISSLQSRNATIVYQYSADGGQGKTQAVFDNLNKQINTLNTKVSQNEYRSTRNESLLNQNSATVQNITKGQDDIKKRLDDTIHKLSTVTEKQETMSVRQDEDVLTIQTYGAKVDDLNARVVSAETSLDALGKRMETSGQEALSSRLNSQSKEISAIKAQQDADAAELENIRLNIGANSKDIATIHESLSQNETHFNSAISAISTLTESTKESETAMNRDITTLRKTMEGEIETRNAVTGNLTKKLNQATDELLTNTGNIQLLLSEQDRSKADFKDLKKRYDALEVNATSDLATLKKRADKISILHNQLEADIGDRFNTIDTSINKILETTTMPNLRTVVINEQYPIEKEELSQGLRDELDSFNSKINDMNVKVENTVTFPAAKPGQMLGISAYKKVVAKDMLVDCYTCDFGDEVSALQDTRVSPIICLQTKRVYIYSDVDDPESREGQARLERGEELGGDDKGYIVQANFFEMGENLNTFYHDVQTGAILFVDTEKNFITFRSGTKSYQLSIAPSTTTKIAVKGLNEVSQVRLLIESTFDYEEEDGQHTYKVYTEPKDTVLRLGEDVMFITNNGEETQKYFVTVN